MSIPTEAVEAGARALLAITPAENLPYVTVPSWADLHGMDQIYYTRLATAALTAAAPLIAAEAVRAELMEVALMLEPFSGIGLANGATRNDVANWLRARAAIIDGKSE